jgi:murein DD-endopeptidase MepM/ murein hydrolase activator NlpD
MARPQASGFATRPDVRARARTRTTKLRRLALAALVLAFVVPIVVLAFDSGTTSRPVSVPGADRLLPAGPPKPQVIALQGSLRLYLPIAETRVTAVGYRAVGEGALPLDPVGTQANAGVFNRLFNRLFGEEEGGIRYNLMGGGPGPETAGLDVGAPVGTDVYAPVDGTVVGLSDRIVDDRVFGVRIEIQPTGSPAVVVVVTNLAADEALTVGSTVAAARTPLGSIIDLSTVETSTLAEYTQDRGQYVHVEVRPAANLSLP